MKIRHILVIVLIFLASFKAISDKYEINQFKLVPLTLFNQVKADDFNSNCPHPSFSRKHLCNHCQNEQDALEFSRHRQDTNVNHVFFGSPNFKVEDGYCVNEPVTAYQCTLKTGYCRFLGNQCQGKHSTSYGHLFYRQVEC